MVLIGKDKSVLAGDAKTILAELASVTDRFLYEMEKSLDGKATYDELLERFLDTIELAATKRNKENYSPNDLVNDHLNDIELFKGQKKGSDPKTNEAIRDLLEKLAEKQKDRKKEKKEKTKK